MRVKNKIINKESALFYIDCVNKKQKILFIKFSLFSESNTTRNRNEKSKYAFAGVIAVNQKHWKA